MHIGTALRAVFHGDGASVAHASGELKSQASTGGGGLRGEQEIEQSSKSARGRPRLVWF